MSSVYELPDRLDPDEMEGLADFGPQPEDKPKEPPPPEPDREGQDSEETRKPTQASMLVAFVRERTTLFHDQNGTVYAKDKSTGEVRRIDGRQFRDWLLAHFFQETEISARDQSLREALGTVAGLGRFGGDCCEVHVRVAGKGGTYYLDLAEPGRNRAVRINSDGWEVVTDPPVMFVRPESMRPLPEPQKNGDIAKLWDIANIPESSRLLVVAWLGDCLRPDTPFPVLEEIGEQGSAKSRALRRLIDPNACDLRAAPKTVEDIFVSAGVNWLVSYENVSHLSQQMQDALCVLATGGGFAKRKLYSDADESVIVVQRPIAINSISAAITSQDLIDRSVSIETPTLETPTLAKWIEVTELWSRFDAEHGRLLGALLDIVADALAHLPRIRLPASKRPRLVEFALFGMAVANAMGRKDEDFLRQFNASRQEAIARTIDASPVASAVIDWFDGRGRQDTEMAVGELMREVGNFRAPNTDAWPRTAKGFGDALRRAAPALRQMGIDCRSLGKLGGTVRWKILRGGKLSAHGAKRVEQFGAHLVRTRRCLLGKRNREYPSHSWPHEPNSLANVLQVLMSCQRRHQARISRTLGHSGLQVRSYPPRTDGSKSDGPASSD
jgi:hypothetical protein